MSAAAAKSTTKTGIIWNIVCVVVSSNMFKDCVNLVGGSGTTYSSSNTGKTYARIDNPPDALGYFSLKSAA